MLFSGNHPYSRRIHFYGADVPSLLQGYLEDPHSLWQSLLDLGCGDGALLHALNRKGLLKGKTVFALDRSKTRIRRARTVDGRFRCWVDDACRVSGLLAECIDFLISSQVIEHVPSDTAMLREIYRLMKPEAICYLSTVFKKKYGWYVYRLNGRWVLDPTHVREYTRPEQLLDIVHGQGFKVLENRRTPIRYPLVDLMLRAVWPDPNTLRYRPLGSLRGIRIPVPGYDRWELVLRKPHLHG